MHPLLALTGSTSRPIDITSPRRMPAATLFLMCCQSGPLIHPLLTYRFHQRILASFDLSWASEASYNNFPYWDWQTNLFLVAPATANTIAKSGQWSSRQYGNRYSSLPISCQKAYQPAMNTKMYENPLTLSNNLERLKKFKLWRNIETAQGSCSSLREIMGIMPSWCQYYYRKSKGNYKWENNLVSRKLSFLLLC